MDLASSLCLSTSKTTTFFLISPRFFRTKILICFRRPFYCLFYVLFPLGFFHCILSSFLWFDIYFFLAKMTHALNNISFSLILSELTSFRITFSFAVQCISKFQCTFLNPFIQVIFSNFSNAFNNYLFFLTHSLYILKA